MLFWDTNLVSTIVYVVTMSCGTPLVYYLGIEDRAAKEPSPKFSQSRRRPTLEPCVLNVKAVVGAFNQEKVLLRAFSVIVKLQNLRRFVASSNQGEPADRPGVLPLQHEDLQEVQAANTRGRGEATVFW